MKILKGLSLFASLIFMIAACGMSDSAQNVLDQNDVVLVDSIGSNKIYFHRNTALVDSLQPLIISRIKVAVDSINTILQFTNVEFRVIVFPERTIPRTGMSGAAPDTNHIYILLNPDHPKLSRSLSGELVPTIAHEYIHTLRHRTIGYGSTLFEALISEGLADNFCLELTGEFPPWIKPFSDEDLAYWQSRAEQEWFNKTYDHQAWFIGLNSEIPRGTGYEIGFNLVKEYLERHPQKRASTLYAVNADNFLVKL